MKKYYSKTIRVGRLSVLLLAGEVIILFRGDRKVYLKKFSHLELPLMKKPLVAGIAAAIVAAGFFFFTTGSPVPEQATLTEDEQKHQILSSRETDFTEQKEEQKLEIKIHRVKSGETLSKIAKIHGVSMDTVCGSNNLNSYDLVNVGMVLKIPNRDGIIYTVKAGEKVSSVLSRYRVPIEKVLAVNEVRNPDFIRPNQHLFIPDAKPLNLVRGFLWPSFQRRITSSYGWRNHPIFGNRHFHKGLDIYCHYNWIRATKYGKVTYTGWLGGYGRTIVISHPGGWKSLYGHLSRISVRRGQYVKQGQIIAKGGNTGNSTGPHLHFELINNGDYRNPYRLLK
ncbi:MAG: M23 family metallopeptidase [Spirochaetes bacterium]|jgi:murein DD-endopeptidase MepM/ murein hydrolase activator NlpD|nr:M23 family metallopeptidase [Spirochaetota bacterium]HPA70885.1 M23 family metallopeptidase [Spirochaetota bacterium]